jgi:peroxiredoxin
MITRAGRSTLLIILLASITALAAGQDEAAPAVATLGKPAPPFTLADTKQQKRSLADYAGRIVVLEWVNPACPYRRVYEGGTMKRTYEGVRRLDPKAIWLAINSTFDATAAQNDFWIREHKLRYPILLDPDGSVGRRYDARRTPQMFVIDAEGILRYQGAIDDNALGNKRPDETTNYVLNAVEQIKAGDVVSPDRIRPYGCAVKYRR